MTDNQVVYVAKLHWLLFLGPVLLGVASLLLASYLPQLKLPAGLLFLSALFWLSVTWVTYYFSSLTIEKKKVIFRTGFVVRKTTDIPYNKIESIDISQSILGSILQYGSLMVTGTGGTRYLINFLTKPLTCRRYIEQLMRDSGS